jgi:DNA-binding NtrC family response regulator
MFKVLILDDSDAYLRSLRGALRREFEVVTAHTLEEAKDLFDERVRVVVVDVRLSEEDDGNRDGVAFLRWAKARSPATPVLMMSAYRDFDAAVEALNMGADYFMRKPIDLRRLREALREFGEKGPQPEQTAALRRRLVQEVE